MPDAAQAIVSACEASYAHRKLCNVFVTDVARKLGVTVSGDADSIIATASLRWRTLSRHEAILAAGKGAFIIAGMKSEEFSTPHEHGHVCVVIPGTNAAFPRVYSTNDSDGPWGKSRGTVPLSHVFPAKDVLKVRYFAPRVGASGSW